MFQYVSWTIAGGNLSRIAVSVMMDTFVAAGNEGLSDWCALIKS